MADTIKEFLVSVGYKVDGSSEKNFERSIRNATLQATLLADTLEALAKKAAQAIAGVARGYDQLHFASARTGASVQNIKALGYAFSQVGGSANDAMSAIEGISKAIRTNPGTRQLMKDLGIAQSKDSAQQALNIANKLASMDHSTAHRYAGLLGLSEEQFLMLKNGELKQRFEEYGKTVERIGFDQKKAADRGYDFSRALGSLSMTMGVLGEKIASDLMPPLTGFLTRTKEWVIAHKDDIAQVITNIANAAKESAGHFTALVAALKPAWEAFDETVKKLTGSNGLTVAFDLLGASLLLRVLAPLRLISTLMLGLKAPAWLLSMMGVSGGAAVAGGAAVLGAGAAAGAMNAPMVDEYGRVTGSWGGKDESKNPAAIGGGGSRGGSGISGGSSTITDSTALKDLITKHESGGKDPYNVVYGNGKYGRPPKPITEMTIAEVLAWQSQMKAKVGSPAFPVGRAQFVESTLRKNALALGYDLNATKLTPEVQEKLFDRLIAQRGNSLTGLRQEWDSLRHVPDGQILAALANGKSNTARQNAPGGPGLFKTLRSIKGKGPDALGIWGHAGAMTDFGAFEPSKLADNGFTMNNVKMVHTTNVNVHGASDPHAIAGSVGRIQEGVNARALTGAKGSFR